VLAAGGTGRIAVMQKITEQQHETTTASRLAVRFEKRFGLRPRVFRAPGRVNLIGEHTDYNDGYVLPAAIDLYTWIAIALRSDYKLHIFSENAKESAVIDLRDEHPRPLNRWSDYVHGVSLMLQKQGLALDGANIAIYSNVPSGAGLSSSAALEVSIASGLLRISGQSLNLVEIARLCQRAENEFVGARVGIMDQFTSCFGVADHAILLDCRSLEYKRLPFPEGIAMVICNTMVKHEHSGGEYNDRRAQCEEGVQLLKPHYPAIKALRDISLSQLESHRSELPELIYRRCHHIISENERVLRSVEALHNADLSTFGRCMAESHLSLKNDYEVSCRELDIMVQLAAGREGVVGSRMTGGGFGGCTINLVRTLAVERFKAGIAEDYKRATGIDAEIYVLNAGVGVAEIGVSA
jgi:galactokinase